MGLDVFDITYEIEKTFDLTLSEDDLHEIVRDNDIVVGDLYDLILKRLNLRDTGRYDIHLNFALWRQIQDIIHWVTNVPLDEVQLKTPLERLFPRSTRRVTWEALRDACPYRVRKLDYPKVVREVGLMLAMGMVLIELFQMWQLPIVKWLWPLLGVFGIWMFAETYMKVLAMLSPLRSRLPTGLTTVKDLCCAVLATNYNEICQSASTQLDERCLLVWEQLTEILVNELGVDADEVTFRSRLLRDFGME